MMATRVRSVALAVAPQDATILQRLIECQEALGNDTSAKQLLERMPGLSQKQTDSESQHARLSLELGTRAMLRKDFVRAESRLREALRRIQADKSPRLKAQAHQLLASLPLKQERVADARAEQTLAAEQLESLVSEITANTALADLKQLRG